MISCMKCEIMQYVQHGMKITLLIIYTFKVSLCIEVCVHCTQPKRP